MEAEIELDIAEDAVSPAFLPHLQSRVRHLLLWGGRDSTKSDFVALLLLIAAMELPYMKCILLRAVQNTVADSQIATLMKVAEREGLSPFFDFRPSALRITCKLNGNSFIGRGTDNMDKVKSVSDPTHVWYEEANQIAGPDAEIVSTTLRSSHPGAVIQEIYTFNPDHQGDYKQFWIWKRFFEATGNPGGTTFAGRLEVDVNGELIQVPYQVVHSTYRNNPWCPPERAATYEAYATTDPYRYRVWCQGLWATKQSGNEWLPRFSRAKHVRRVEYLPGVNIFQSWDANSLPYSAMICAQTVDNRARGGKLQLRVFQEYAIRSPNSGLSSTGKQFLLDRRAKGWAGSDVFLTGDASLKARKPGEENQTNFKDVLAALAGAKDADGNTVAGCLNGSSADFWLRKNPSVMTRRDFLNYLLSDGLPDVELIMDEGCAELIADAELTQVGIDGKLKEMYTDPVLNVRYQLRGHFTDVWEYLICTVLAGQYEQFKATRGA